jgi:palmitoyltransferase
MFTSPGYVPDPFKPRYISNKLPQSNKNLERKERDDLYCKKCRNPRPPRAHHCKICRKCTLKMDHHCQWIANCVGYYNQKNFYQFLFYATTGDLVGCIFLFMRLPYCNFNIRENIPPGIKIKSPLSLMYYMWEPIQISIGALCGLAMTISIGTLFYKQTWMLLLNQTTIDKKLFEDWNNSPYYEENKSKNFKSVMGESFCDWISLKFEGNEPFNYSKRKKYYNLDNIESET